MNTIFHHSSGIEQDHIIQVCAEKKNLRLKLMMCKLEKSNGLEVLKIFIYYFYKKIFIKICIKQHIMKYVCKIYIKQCPVMY